MSKIRWIRFAWELESARGSDRFGLTALTKPVNRTIRVVNDDDDEESTEHIDRMGDEEETSSVSEGAKAESQLDIVSRITNRCRLCGKAFRVKLSLEKHMMIMHPDSICKPNSIRSLYMKTVGKDLEPENTVSCIICEKKFKLRISLKKHIKDEHKDFGSNRCYICGKKFSAKIGLQKHLSLAHIGLTNLRCKLCGYAFTAKGSLKKHILNIHKGATGYPCPRCGKVFSQIYNMRIHVANVHDGIRSDPCHICGRRFSQQSRLRKHIEITHIGGCERGPVARKIALCPICGKSFSHSYNMRIHVANVHEGIRSDPCEICGRIFSQDSRLRRHMAVAHGGDEGTNSCDICGRIFNKLFNLQVHMATMHPGTGPEQENKSFLLKTIPLPPTKTPNKLQLVHANSPH